MMKIFKTAQMKMDTGNEILVIKKQILRVKIFPIYNQA